MRRTLRSRKREPLGATVAIEAEEARATTPEGAVAHMTVSDLLGHMAPHFPDTRDAILSDGVKALLPMAGGLIVVHQTPPLVYNFKWIARDSKADYGPRAKYRSVRLSLPYLIVLAVFEGRGRVPQLGSRNECYFSNQPLEAAGLDTQLCYPALLNCSRFPDDPKHPLSWICSQYLPEDEYAGRSDLDSSLRAGLRALRRHLLESGFNLSSEHHEISSWYSESVAAGIDPRIATVETWEEATKVDPLFVLDVPWLPTGRTLREITTRIAAAGSNGSARFRSADDIARVIFNRQTGESAK